MESFASRFFHGHAGKSFASRLFLGCSDVVSLDPQIEKIHAELLLTAAGTYWVFFFAHALVLVSRREGLPVELQLFANCMFERFRPAICQARHH